MGVTAAMVHYFRRPPHSISPRKRRGEGREQRSWGRAKMLQLITFSTLNGVLYGMLLFMMASGLTL
ncbi:MAG TPA: hypothetical protein VE267_06155, partial [Bradyrhizobium sp.]|nr:hypothetical protein [Bradyrhizobium sp.]